MLIQVRDLYAAGYIIAKGVKLDHTEPADDGFVNFFFAEDEAGPVLAEWYDPQATTNVHDFLEALKQLRRYAKAPGVRR